MDDEAVQKLTRGRGLSPVPIAEQHGLQFLAVDELDQWAGAFGFALNAKGDAFTDGVLYQRSVSGEWDETGSGGGGSSGWDVPWALPLEVWDGQPMLSLGCAGHDCELDDGTAVLVLVHFGFVRPDVRQIELRDDLGERTIDITSPCGAFAAVAVGAGVTTFRLLDESGAAVGEHTYRPRQEDVV